MKGKTILSEKNFRKNYQLDQRTIIKLCLYHITDWLQLLLETIKLYFSLLIISGKHTKCYFPAFVYKNIEGMLLHVQVPEIS